MCVCYKGNLDLVDSCHMPYTFLLPLHSICGQVLFDDALSSKDLSNATLSTMAKVAMLLLDKHMAWSCSVMAQCAEVYGMQVSLEAGI